MMEYTPSDVLLLALSIISGSLKWDSLTANELVDMGLSYPTTELKVKRAAELILYDRLSKIQT